MIKGTRVKDDTGRTGVVIEGITLLVSDAVWVVTVQWDGAEGFESIPEYELTIIAAAVSAKAEDFAVHARRAGWTALARNGSEDGVSIVSARTIGGVEIILGWKNGRYDYSRSCLKQANGRTRKIRNVSDAKKLLATL